MRITLSLRLVYIGNATSRPMPHPRSRSIPRRAQALDQVESRYAKSDARSRCMQVDYVARMGMPRETMPFSLVNRVFHQACHTRITDSTGLIVCRGLPKTQEKSSTSLPFSTKSSPRVTDVTPGQRGTSVGEHVNSEKIPKHLFLCSERMFGDTDRAWRSP